MAKKKNEIDLVSILTHNVKGPIKFMQHVTDHTIEHWHELSKDELFECAEVINETSRQISHLLNNMLQWQQLKQKNIKRSNGRFNLYELVTEQTELYKSVCFLKKLDFQIKITKKLVVDTDRFLLGLILQNILSNALKFSFINSTVTIKGIVKEGVLKLSIEDQGKGMTDEEVELMLSDQLYTTIGTFEESGTGFGTTIVRELTALLEGKLTIKSKLDAGTQVTLAIPI